MLVNDILNMNDDCVVSHDHTFNVSPTDWNYAQIKVNDDSDGVITFGLFEDDLEHRPRDGLSITIDSNNLTYSTTIGRTSSIIPLSSIVTHETDTALQYAKVLRNDDASNVLDVRNKGGDIFNITGNIQNSRDHFYIFDKALSSESLYIELEYINTLDSSINRPLHDNLRIGVVNVVDNVIFGHEEKKSNNYGYLMTIDNAQYMYWSADGSAYQYNPVSMADTTHHYTTWPSGTRLQYGYSSTGEFTLCIINPLNGQILWGISDTSITSSASRDKLRIALGMIINEGEIIRVVNDPMPFGGVFPNTLSNVATHINDIIHIDRPSMSGTMVTKSINSYRNNYNKFTIVHEPNKVSPCWLMYGDSEVNANSNASGDLAFAFIDESPGLLTKMMYNATGASFIGLSFKSNHGTLTSLSNSGITILYDVANRQILYNEKTYPIINATKDITGISYDIKGTKFILYLHSKDNIGISKWIHDVGSMVITPTSNNLYHCIGFNGIGKITQNKGVDIFKMTTHEPIFKSNRRITVAVNFSLNLMNVYIDSTLLLSDTISKTLGNGKIPTHSSNWKWKCLQNNKSINVSFVTISNLLYDPILSGAGKTYSILTTTLNRKKYGIINSDSNIINYVSPYSNTSEEILTYSPTHNGVRSGLISKHSKHPTDTPYCYLKHQIKENTLIGVEIIQLGTQSGSNYLNDISMGISPLQSMSLNTLNTPNTYLVNSRGYYQGDGVNCLEAYYNIATMSGAFDGGNHNHSSVSCTNTYAAHDWNGQGYDSIAAINNTIVTPDTYYEFGIDKASRQSTSTFIVGLIHKNTLSTVNTSGTWMASSGSTNGLFSAQLFTTTHTSNTSVSTYTGTVTNTGLVSSAFGKGSIIQMGISQTYINVVEVVDVEVVIIDGNGVVLMRTLITSIETSFGNFSDLIPMCSLPVETVSNAFHSITSTLAYQGTLIGLTHAFTNDSIDTTFANNGYDILPPLTIGAVDKMFHHYIGYKVVGASIRLYSYTFNNSGLLLKSNTYLLPVGSSDKIYYPIFSFKATPELSFRVLHPHEMNTQPLYDGFNPYGLTIFESSSVNDISNTYVKNEPIKSLKWKSTVPLTIDINDKTIEYTNQFRTNNITRGILSFNGYYTTNGGTDNLGYLATYVTNSSIPSQVNTLYNFKNNVPNGYVFTNTSDLQLQDLYIGVISYDEINTTEPLLNNDIHVMNVSTHMTFVRNNSSLTHVSSPLTTTNTSFIDGGTNVIPSSFSANYSFAFYVIDNVMYSFVYDPNGDLILSGADIGDSILNKVPCIILNNTLLNKELYIKHDSSIVNKTLTSFELKEQRIAHGISNGTLVKRNGTSYEESSRFTTSSDIALTNDVKELLNPNEFLWNNNDFDNSTNYIELTGLNKRYPVITKQLNINYTTGEDMYLEYSVQNIPTELYFIFTPTALLNLTESIFTSTDFIRKSQDIVIKVTSSTFSLYTSTFNHNHSGSHTNRYTISIVRGSNLIKCLRDGVLLSDLNIVSTPSLLSSLNDNIDWTFMVYSDTPIRLYRPVNTIYPVVGSNNILTNIDTVVTDWTKYNENSVYSLDLIGNEYQLKIDDSLLTSVNLTNIDDIDIVFNRDVEFITNVDLISSIDTLHHVSKSFTSDISQIDTFITINDLTNSIDYKLDNIHSTSGHIGNQVNDISSILLSYIASSDSINQTLMTSELSLSTIVIPNIISQTNINDLVIPYAEINNIEFTNIFASISNDISSLHVNVESLLSKLDDITINNIDTLYNNVNGSLSHLEINITTFDNVISSLNLTTINDSMNILSNDVYINIPHDYTNEFKHLQNINNYTQSLDVYNNINYTIPQNVMTPNINLSILDDIVTQSNILVLETLDDLYDFSILHNTHVDKMLNLSLIQENIGLNENIITSFDLSLDSSISIFENIITSFNTIQPTLINTLDLSFTTMSSRLSIIENGLLSITDLIDDVELFTTLTNDSLNVINSISHNVESNLTIQQNMASRYVDLFIDNTVDIINSYLQ